MLVLVLYTSTISGGTIEMLRCCFDVVVRVDAEETFAWRNDISSFRTFKAVC